MSTENETQSTETVQTQETTQETSLRDEIAGAIDQSEKASTAGTDVSEAARTLAAQRKAGESTETTTADKTAASGEKKTTETTETVEAPQHWPATDREMFAKQSPEAQKWILGRHKAMEADYTRRTQEIAPIRRLKEGIDEVFAPFRDAMARDGIDEVSAIKQLVAAHNYLQQKPAEAIGWLAEKYGIDLKQVVEGAGASGTEGQPDPRLLKLDSKVAEVDKKVTSVLTAHEQREHQARLNEVTQFADAKDAQGKPLRPYFDEVATDIRDLIVASGGKLALQDAYDRAIYANPQTRAKVLAAQDAERRAKEEAERKAKADAAKKASAGNVSGQGAATSVVAKTDSLRADLVSAFEASEGRV